MNKHETVPFESDAELSEEEINLFDEEELEFMGGGTSPNLGCVRPDEG